MISERIKEITAKLPPEVQLVAVSKFHPLESIREAYEAGQRAFAESRPQELQKKVMAIREDTAAPLEGISWHFIGHLQTNKLKMVLPYVSLVQSVDSVRLLDAINAWAQTNDKVINVLLEPHIAAEQTKQGFVPEEITDILSRSSEYPGISFRGIMGMATFTDEEAVIRKDFAAIKGIFENARACFPSLRESFTELSIGMSDDYPTAVEYGSTMVRIGTMIFGNRNY